MVGLIVYIIIQVALAGFAVYIFVNREEIRARHVQRKDNRRQNVVIVLLIPAMAFGYCLLGGFPPKSDQLIFMTAFTVVMYVSVGFRWVRQSPISNTRANDARLYFYRSNDGTVCGPETGRKFSALIRLGFVTGDTPVAEEGSPDVWKPLRDYTEIDTSSFSN